MIPTATKNRRGLMGSNHVRRLARVESIVKDPLAFTDIEPTLDLDFTDIKGAPFAGNLTRATVGGYRMNSKGVMVPTVVNEPVIDFGTDGKPVGTGFWGAYTNLLLRSEELDNAAWTKTLTTISANAITGPDGATTFDKIVEDSSAGTHIAIQTVSLANGSTFTGSVTLKAAERTFVRVRLGDSGFVGDVAVDLSTGLVYGGTGTSSVVALGNGFYRVSVTGTVAAGNIASIQITLRQSSSVESYTGDGVSGLYAGQLSITATSFPVPYVPTTSATVPRNADSMVISGTDFTDFFNPVEGTIFVDAVASRGTNTFVILVQFSDNTYNNRVFTYYDEALQLLYGRTTAGGVVQATGTFPVNRGASFKSAYAYKADSFLFSANGATALSDLSGSVPSGITKVNIGSDHIAASPLNEHIRRVVYWPKALSAAELQRMTA